MKLSAMQAQQKTRQGYANSRDNSLSLQPSDQISSKLHNNEKGSLGKKQSNLQIQPLTDQINLIRHSSAL